MHAHIHNPAQGNVSSIGFRGKGNDHPGILSRLRTETAHTATSTWMQAFCGQLMTIVHLLLERRTDSQTGLGSTDRETTRKWNTFKTHI